MGMWRDSLWRIPPIGSCLVGIRGEDHAERLGHAEGLVYAEGLDNAEGPPACFVVASGGGLSEGYGHGRPGVCLGDGQTEDEGGVCCYN